MAQNAMKLVYGVSLAVHLGGGAALVAFEEHRPPAPTVVEMRTVESKPKPAAEAPPPPPPPPPRERAPRAARPAPAPAAAPPPTEAPPPAAAADVPDFGFALSGVGAGGAGGIAVPVGNGGRAPAPVTRQAARTLAAAAPTTHADDGECTDAEVRPRPLAAIPRPAYTDDARQAQIEGRVRIELTIDENGHVTAARVLESLGHGLDEAALAAVREASFSPATRCGRPVSATVKIGLTFNLGV